MYSRAAGGCTCSIATSEAVCRYCQPIAAAGVQACWAPAFTFDITPKLNLNVSGENLTKPGRPDGGHPRQGVFSQSIVNGSFYGRSVAGANALISLTYTF